MAAILKFLLPVTWVIIYNSAIDFLHPENMGVAVGISFLGATEAEIRLRYMDIQRNFCGVSRILKRGGNFLEVERGRFFTGGRERGQIFFRMGGF